MKSDKYLCRLKAIDALQELHDQIVELIGTLDDPEQVVERNRALFCLREVAQLNHQLRTTFAPFPVLGFNQRLDIASTVYEAEDLLKQHGNA